MATQIKSRLATVAESVSLFTHYQAIQLSVMMNFVILSRRMQARKMNLTFLWQNHFQVYTAHMHVSVSSGIPGLCIDNVVSSSSVFEALLLV